MHHLLQCLCSSSPHKAIRILAFGKYDNQYFEPFCQKLICSSHRCPYTSPISIIDNIYDGEAVKTPIGISGGWAPFDSVYTPDEWEPFPYDPALARQLLEEAGYSDGDVSIRFLITPMEQQPNLEQVAEAVARDWEAVGIDVERVMTEYAVQRQIWAERRNNDACQLRVWGPNPEPWSGGIIYGHPTWIEGYNDGYEDYKLDELLLNAAETFDTDADSSIQRFMAIFPALLILLLALIIGFIIIATLWPIVQMTLGGGML